VNDVVALADITEAHRSFIGGKAWHLGRLAAVGLPVPEGVVVTTGAFARALDDWGWTERAGSASDLSALKLDIAGKDCPVALLRSLTFALRGVPGPFAVRSSAVDEDGGQKSFAGQYRTELGVSAADLGGALMRCWASLYSEEPTAYRGDAPPNPGGMAVVVQRMVQPHAAGVLFTVNPLSGSWREMTVEAVYGLADPLVSGQVTPQWYLVRRPRKAPRPVQRVLSRVRLQVLQQDLPPLTTQLVGSGSGVQSVPVPASRQSRPALDRRALFRVCRMGLKVEALSGTPQDVEWAIDVAGTVFLLQARPITRQATPRVRDDVLWTRRFIGERWPMPATPLGWSLMQPVLEHFIAYPRTQQRYLGGGPPLKLVNSRPYVNVTAFRYLTFKLPGAPPPRFMMELVPPEEEAEWQSRFAGMPDVSVYLSYLRETLAEARWRRFAFNPLTNPQQWEAFAKRLRDVLPVWEQPCATSAVAVARVIEQQAWVTEYVGIHLCSLLFANLTYQLLESSLTEAIPEKAASLMTALAVCPPGNRTLETNAALWTLAQQASPAQLERLAEGKLPRGRFRVALDAFLETYGHRSMASWELFTPRWREEPSQMAPLLRAFAGKEMAEPNERAVEQDVAFAKALTEVLVNTVGAQRGRLHRLIDSTRTYLLLRENQRFDFDRLLAAQQRTLLGLGAEFVRSGALPHEGDIALLTWDEVRRLAEKTLGSSAIRDIVAARAQQRERDSAHMPPVFLQGDDGVGAPVSGPRLQGLGISGGRATGPVVIVHHPSEASRVPEGAILVARAVDPGWTPIFGKVAGIVLELGSRLSHGAVVAREYGLPAVVNLDGITGVLTEGQIVTVDGTRGIVWTHDSGS
jgi:phosphohistidine swiveling domain-containing protein